MYQFSYKVGFYEGKILKFILWITGSKDSIQAENTARKMCNNQYNIKIIERE